MTFILRTVRASKLIYRRKLKKPIRTTVKDVGIGLFTTMIVSDDSNVLHSIMNMTVSDTVIVLLSSIFVSSRMSKIMYKNSSSTHPPYSKKKKP